MTVLLRVKIGVKSDFFGVREKTTLQSIVLRFRSDLIDLIGLDRKRSLSYTEDSTREDRTKNGLKMRCENVKLFFLGPLRPMHGMRAALSCSL